LDFSRTTVDSKKKKKEGDRPYIKWTEKKGERESISTASKKKIGGLQKKKKKKKTVLLIQPELPNRAIKKGAGAHPVQKHRGTHAGKKKKGKKKAVYKLPDKREREKDFLFRHRKGGPCQSKWGKKKKGGLSQSTQKNRKTFPA